MTAEFATVFTESLRLGNDRYARDLARRSIGRLIFRYVMLRPQFEAYRQRVAKPSLRDIDCFVGLLSEKLTDDALSVVKLARVRNTRYDQLLHHLYKRRLPRKIFSGRFAKLEAEILKRVISFELSANKDERWSFRHGGLAQLNDDFLLLREFLGGEEDQLNQLCDRWGQFFLSDADRSEIETADENERASIRISKLKPFFEPLWFFFVSLCRSLQSGENELSATDAFWLGLIDEVIGNPELPILRAFVEFQDDPPPSSATS